MLIHSIGEFSVRLLVALVLGSLIGAERQYRQRMAGLRTNALVAIGAALFVMVSSLDGRGDPTRVAAQVVSGIGFLAGAVIFREGVSVQGLNTAATLWATAAVGTLVGGGYLLLAAIGTAAVLVVHVVLRPLAQRINREPVGQEVLRTYELRAVCTETVEPRVRATLIAAVRRGALTLHAVYREDLAGEGRVEVVADVAGAGPHEAELEKIVTEVGLEPGVSAISWKMVPATAEEIHLTPES
jgi:putative Mg2+ transporter-C (MgtC) family protein